MTVVLLETAITMLVAGLMLGVVGGYVEDRPLVMVISVSGLAGCILGYLLSSWRRD